MKNSALFLAFLFLCHCATSPKGADVPLSDYSDVGVWKGKALMTNVKTKHKKWASVVWVSDSKQKKMRVNVTAVLDIPIASYLQTSNSSDLWLFTENKHFQSVDSKKLFFHLTKVNIHPALFFDFLGAPKDLGGAWRCQSRERVMKCSEPINKIHLTVAYQSLDERRVDVFDGKNHLKLNLSRAKVEVRPRFFKPLSLPQYKTIEI